MQLDVAKATYQLGNSAMVKLHQPLQVLFCHGVIHCIHLRVTNKHIATDLGYLVRLTSEYRHLSPFVFPSPPRRSKLFRLDGSNRAPFAFCLSYLSPDTPSPRTCPRGRMQP